MSFGDATTLAVVYTFLGTLLGAALWESYRHHFTPFNRTRDDSGYSVSFVSHVRTTPGMTYYAGPKVPQQRNGRGRR